jgi:uncharacterized protein YnzC (UPF0291/DUF896 family)
MLAAARPVGEELSKAIFMLQAKRRQEGKNSQGRDKHASLREDYLNQVQRDFLSQIASKSDLAPLA